MAQKIWPRDAEEKTFSEVTEFFTDDGTGKLMGKISKDDLKLGLTIDGNELSPVKGGADEANATPILPGPSNQIRKREASPGWYSVNGQTVEAEKGHRWLWVSDNGALSLWDGGVLPKTEVANETGNSTEKAASQQLVTSVKNDLGDVSTKVEPLKESEGNAFAITGPVVDHKADAAFKVGKNGYTYFIQELNNMILNLMRAGFEFGTDNKVIFPGATIVSIIENIFESGLAITDEQGFVAAKMDANGVEANHITAKTFSLPIQPNGWLYGKSIWAVADSLGAPGIWQLMIASMTGAIWKHEYKDVTSQGGTKTLEEQLYDRSGFTRTRLLVDLYKAGQKVEVIFVENYNDGGIRPGNFQEEPYFEGQILLNSTDTVPQGQSVATYVRANLSTFLSNAKKLDYSVSTGKWTEGAAGAFSPVAHTILHVRQANPTKTSWILKLNAAPSAAGTIKVNVGTTSYTIALNGTETIRQVYEKVLEYDYRRMNDAWVDSADFTKGVLFAYNEGSSTDFSIQFTGGVSGTTTTQTGGFDMYKFVYKSLNVANWNTAANWVLRDTEYQPEYGSQAGQFGPSKYQMYKGLIEYLVKNIPDVEIVWVSPTSSYFPTDLQAAASDPSWSKYFYPSGDINFHAVITQMETNKRETADVADDVCRKYGYRSIKLSDNAGMNVFNAPRYYNGVDVHPKNLGYQRWGEMIVKELYN